jgi:hypothetical protein
LSLRRRTLLAGAVLAPAWAAAKGLEQNYVAAIATALQNLPAGPALLNSYITSGDSDFDITQANAAYVYDNALAGLALHAAGLVAPARRIAEALAIAQAHDRFYTDGRLRNAYMAGPMSQPAKLPGWWDKAANRWDEDPYQVGSQTGPVAWAMLLWTALGMRAPARRAGAWINAQLRAPNGYYGGFYGFEPNPLKLTWQSTEQNTDLVAAFGQLGDTASAAHAATFVGGMFNSTSGTFNAGLAPDGSTNPLLAADAGIWPYLAHIGFEASAASAIKKLQHGGGIGFSAASAGIWLEGTAFSLLALKTMHNSALGQQFAATLAANVSANGYLYATVAPQLATGLTVGPSLQDGVAPKPFIYFRRPALSTTAWAALASLGVNPLRTG